MCVARGPRCPWPGQAGRPGPPGPSAPPAVAVACPGTGIYVKIMRLNKKKLLLNEKKASITKNWHFEQKTSLKYSTLLPGTGKYSVKNARKNFEQKVS